MTTIGKRDWTAGPDQLIILSVALTLSYQGIGNFPGEVSHFSVPAEGIRRWDEATLVYDVRLGANAGLSERRFEGGAGPRHRLVFQLRRAERNGRTHVVKDEDDFACSVAADFIDASEARGAWRGLNDLLAPAVRRTCYGQKQETKW